MCFSISHIHFFGVATVALAVLFTLALVLTFEILVSLTLIASVAFTLAFFCCIDLNSSCWGFVGLSGNSGIHNNVFGSVDGITK